MLSFLCVNTYENILFVSILYKYINLAKAIKEHFIFFTDKIEEIKLEGMKSDENSEKSKGEKWKLTNTIASKRSLDSVQLVTNTVKNEAMGNEIISFKKDDAIEYETEFSNVKKKMSISEDRKRKIEDSQSTKDSSSDLSEICMFFCLIHF